MLHILPHHYTASQSSLFCKPQILHQDKIVHLLDNKVIIPTQVILRLSFWNLR